MIKTNWTGDDGSTRISGEAAAKDSLRVDAVGEIDELNSFVGLARTMVEDEKIQLILKNIQPDLLSIGSELAKARGDKSRLAPERVTWIEGVIKDVDSRLPDLSRFILPGGSQPAAALHVCRAVCRRAERKCVSLKRSEIVSDEIIKYLNRLSSLLFSLARLVNFEYGVSEEEW